MTIAGIAVMIVQTFAVPGFAIAEWKGAAAPRVVAA